MKNPLARTGLFLTPLILLAGLVVAQQRPPLTPEQLELLTIRPVPGKPGLYLLPGFDGNMAVRVTGEGVIVVDNKFSDSHADIVRQIGTVTDQPIRYVLNTHHHFDHAGSNADFMPAAQVIGHENVRVNILRNQQAGPPPVTYSQRSSVHLGDATVQLHHFGRGHTNGDSVILFSELGVVHTGDLVIWGDRLDGSTLAPFIDFDNGGSAAEWTATLDGLLALEFDTVIPGHGPLLTRAEVQTFRDKFEQLVSRTQRLLDQGVSRDGIVTELDIEDLNWPLVPARIQAIYDELAR
jgi:glyoxylase-like metal-dependent hydrolase (beta-lactamase superfamily II)